MAACDARLALIAHNLVVLLLQAFCFFGQPPKAEDTGSLATTLQAPTYKIWPRSKISHVAIRSPYSFPLTLDAIPPRIMRTYMQYTVAVAAAAAASIPKCPRLVSVLDEQHHNGVRLF